MRTCTITVQHNTETQGHMVPTAKQRRASGHNEGGLGDACAGVSGQVVGPGCEVMGVIVPVAGLWHVQLVQGLVEGHQGGGSA